MVATGTAVAVVAARVAEGRLAAAREAAGRGCSSASTAVAGAPAEAGSARPLLSTFFSPSRCEQEARPRGRLANASAALRCCGWATVCPSRPAAADTRRRKCEKRLTYVPKRKMRKEKRDKCSFATNAVAVWRVVRYSGQKQSSCLTSSRQRFRARGSRGGGVIALRSRARSTY
jgi:hypothetical protein